MQSWARGIDDGDVARDQAGGGLPAQAVTHDDGVVLAAPVRKSVRCVVDCGLSERRVGRVVVQAAAEQLDVDDVRRPGRAQVERPGQDFAGDAA